LGGELNTPQPNDPKQAKTSSLFATRPALIIASILAIFGWVWVFAGVWAYYGRPKTTFDIASRTYPFVYLSASIFCGFVDMSPRRLLITAVVLHLPIVAFLGYAFTEAGVDIWPGTLFCIAFAVLWFGRVGYAYYYASQRIVGRERRERESSDV
jgi:hypothetical protein